MTNGSQKKTRSQLVAGLDPVPKLSTQIWKSISRSEVLVRVALCVLAALVLVVATRAWQPPFTFRRGDIPARNIVAGTKFQIPNKVDEEEAKRKARQQAPQAYINDPKPLENLRARLGTNIDKVIATKELDAEALAVWQQFLPPQQEATPSTDTANEQVKRSFENFRFALKGQDRLEFNSAIERAFEDLEEHGLLLELKKLDGEPGNETDIKVSRKDERGPSSEQNLEVDEVKISTVTPKFHKRLEQELEKLEAGVIQRAREELRQTYVHDPQPLVKLRSELTERVKALQDAAEFDEATATLWKEFVAPATADKPLPDAEEQKKQFEEFRAALAELESLDPIVMAVEKILGKYEKQGLLLELKPAAETAEANQKEIVIIYLGEGDDPKDTRETVAVESVRLKEIKPLIPGELENELKSVKLASHLYNWLDQNLPRATTLQYRPRPESAMQNAAPELANRAFQWLEGQFPVTLTYDTDRSSELREEAADDIEPEDYATKYNVGDTLAKANEPIDAESRDRLYKEHQQLIATLPATEGPRRALAVLGMYLALYTLCGLFIHYRYPEILADIRRFASLLGLSAATIVLCYFSEQWKVEMIPLLLFGMTVAIAYNQELALLVSAAVGLVVVLSLGQGLVAFVILMAATATAVLMLRRVRSRVKLVYVGFFSGAVAMLTTIGVSAVDGQPLGYALLLDAGLYGLWGIAAGFIMTGLLPFIENAFGVLTDISLLELGDVAHPLLQELVRRAPGTYNHSINVASMAESAAERIGGRGLLVRVGAYFHDIGKMLKPQYFVENQVEGGNQHESLMPAMSTLIIIAHVKDGAELAREHHLPRPIIDFIQQHHGTTLVEYFYRRASENSQQDPDGGDVDENAFRYPGPKPQTKEAGILMLADAVESASRVLVEPTPSRIESLVEDIAMKRLLDGQLDESGLTLQEVRTVEDSLVKSLTAVYHGRVKYPDQKTA